MICNMIITKDIDRYVKKIQNEFNNIELIEKIAEGVFIGNEFFGFYIVNKLPDNIRETTHIIMINDYINEPTNDLTIKYHNITSCIENRIFLAENGVINIGNTQACIEFGKI